MNKVCMTNWEGFNIDTVKTWKDNIGQLVSFDTENVSTNIYKYEYLGFIKKVDNRFIYLTKKQKI